MYYQALVSFFFPPGRSSRKDQKWRGPDENIRANLRQYGTEKLYVDVMVADASKPVWRETALFDAIITDRMFVCHHGIYVIFQKLSFAAAHSAFVSIHSYFTLVETGRNH